MKKTLPVTVIALLAGAVSAYAQGIVLMADYQFIGIQVFASQSTGNNATVSWGGYTGSELIGNNSGNSYDNGNGPSVTFTGTPLGAGYSVELLAGPATDTSVSQLAETGAVISTWYSGSAATGLGGFWQSEGGPGFLATVSGVPEGGNAAVAIAGWYNAGGTITSLAKAQAAGVPWGVSNLGTADALGGGPIAPSSPTGLDSFSLVPEPGTVALGVVGASAFLFHRRKFSFIH